MVTFIRKELLAFILERRRLVVIVRIVFKEENMKKTLIVFVLIIAMCMLFSCQKETESGYIMRQQDIKRSCKYWINSGYGVAYKDKYIATSIDPYKIEKKLKIGMEAEDVFDLIGDQLYRVYHDEAETENIFVISYELADNKTLMLTFFYGAEERRGCILV